jgi:hypothetical protein
VPAGIITSTRPSMKACSTPSLPQAAQSTKCRSDGNRAAATFPAATA